MVSAHVDDQSGSTVTSPPVLIPCVESDLPEPNEYWDNFKRAHEVNRYSNFGALSESFGNGLLSNFGLGGEACVTCSSATAGLSAALVASRVSGPVLVPAFTFPATFGAVRAAGLVPLIMDVDASTWVIAPEKLEALLSVTGAAAVILVTPYGLRTDFSSQIAVCRRHGAVVIIDSAAGLGVERVTACYDDNLFEVFSLHATKPMGVGEGGLVFCSKAMAPLVRSAINFGLSRHADGVSADWGFNGKLSEFHAAIGLAQLERYRPIIAGRQQFAARYFDLLSRFPVSLYRVLPEAAPWQVFPVLLPSETVVQAFVGEMLASGLEVRRYYRPSLSQSLGAYLAEPCPVSELLAARTIALPIRDLNQSLQAQYIFSCVQSSLINCLKGAA